MFLFCINKPKPSTFLLTRAAFRSQQECTEGGANDLVPSLSGNYKSKKYVKEKKN